MNYSNAGMADKYVLKYVKSKELLQYNKSVELGSGDTGQIVKEEKTAESRKDIMKDPTRVAYISKNFYTPKNL